MSAATPSAVAVGVGLALAGLCVILGWPALLDPTGQALGGGGGDLNGLAWTLWRIGDALPTMPVHHPDIQWPAGAHLAPVALPQALLTLPLTRHVGPVASVNLLQVLHIGLAGGLMALWAGRRGAGPAGQAAAGVAFGLAPVLLASVHNGNPDVTPVFWLPLVGLLAEGAAASWAAAVGLGAALALAPGWSPYVGVMAGLVALVCAPWPRGAAAWARLGGAAAVGALGVAAWGAFYTGAVGGEEALVLKRAATPVAPGAAGLLGFVHGGATSGGADGWSVHRWYLGLAALGGAGVGLAALRRAGARPAVLLGVGVLLALGPVLQWDGAPLDVAGRHLALPGAAWVKLPGLDGLRLVWRYAALASLGVAVLLAHGVSALPRPARWLAPGVVALDLLLLGGGAADLRAGPVVDDGGCALLAGREAGPVLSLPHDHAERSLLGQTCHGMPVAGSLNRVPGRRVQAALAEGPAALHAMGFRWLLLRTDAPGDGGAEARAMAERSTPAAAQGGTVLVDLAAQP